ncbi:hypothetical protein [Fluviicola sp.]|uniref:hypothetical protein n=1 Tax=Fluviicola sp. TaxID=1917219 RepID=UPI0031D0C1B8
MAIHNTNEFTLQDYSSFPLELREQLIAAIQCVEDKAMINMFAIFAEGVCKEVSAKVEILEKRTARYPHSRPIIEMLLDKLRRFANGDALKADVKLIIYHRDLAQRLERIDWENHKIDVFAPVDEVLIYMNYNSKSYISMLQLWLRKRIQMAGSLSLKLQKLNLFSTHFLQLHRKPDVKLHPDHLDITDALDHWFSLEKGYIENEWEILEKAQESKVETHNMERIKWLLPSDQLAILIRAGFDAGIISAKSMNSLYQQLIKYCSSIQKDHLSPSAVRSSAYNPEQVTKDLLLEWLKKVMKWIDGY